MFRRDFLKRAAAAVAWCFGGTAAVKAALLPPKQVSKHVKLFLVRSGQTPDQFSLLNMTTGFKPIDWFEQKPGDRIIYRTWAGSHLAQEMVTGGKALLVLEPADGLCRID